MRIAFVLSRLACRDELAPGPIDAEWLAATTPDLDPVVLVDHESPGSQLLRDEGVEVHVSDKRELGQPSGVSVTTEEVQGRLLLQAHQQDPFDAVVYGTDRASTLVSVARELSSIPTGVALGPGPVAAQRLLLDHPEPDVELWTEIWAAAGFVASADFLVSDVAPTAYGFQDAPDLPPRRGLRPVPAVEDELATPPGLVVVVATTEDLRGLASLPTRVAQRLEIGRLETLVLVHPESADKMSVAEVIREGAPPLLRRRLVLARPGPDGVAASFLGCADQLVCARAADLAMPAVAARARSVPTLVLDRSGLVPTPSLLEGVPPPRDYGGSLVPVSLREERGTTVEQLDRIAAERMVAGVVLYRPDHERVAREMVRVAAPAGLTFVAEPLPPYRRPDTSQPCPHVLAVGEDLWSSLRRQLLDGSDLPAMVRAGLDPSGMDSHVVTFLAAETGCDPAGSSAAVPSSGWRGSLGLLPRPRLPRGGPGLVTRPAGTARNVSGDRVRAWAGATRWADRVRLVLPWRLGLAELVEPDGDLPLEVRRWAKDHRWADRVRLALPWRWGLLPRAMEGRW